MAWTVWGLNAGGRGGGEIFLHPSRLALVPTQPAQLVWSLSPRGKVARAWHWPPTPSSAKVKWPIRNLNDTHSAKLSRRFVNYEQKMVQGKFIFTCEAAYCTAGGKTLAAMQRQSGPLYNQQSCNEKYYLYYPIICLQDLKKAILPLLTFRYR